MFRSVASSEKQTPLLKPIGTEVLCFRGKVDTLKKGFAPNYHRNPFEILYSRGFWEKVRNVCIGDSKPHTGI